jgi:hypothetical protein
MTKAKTRLNRTYGNPERVHAYLSIEKLDEVKEAARVSWVSVSEWIEEACKQRLERIKENK